MQEAMRIMRRELGEEAIVVNTRSIVQRRAFPWLKGRSEVEVIARVDDTRRAQVSTLTRSASEVIDVATKTSLALRVSELDDSRVLSPAQLAEHLERELLEPDRFVPSDSGIELSPSLERLISPRSSTGNSRIAS